MKRIGGVLDPHIRTHYLRYEVRKLPPELLAEMVEAAHARANAGHGGYTTLLLGLSVALGDHSTHELRMAAAQIARDSNLAEAAEFLTGGPSRRTMNPRDARLPNPVGGRRLTLGERKTLARKPDRRLIARAIRDPDPAVVEILLRNPALTEDDIVRLCARRPIVADVLRRVFQHSRWNVRYRVQRTLVRNPYTPLEIAIQLAAQLTAQDARAVADSPELDARVRDACRRRLTPAGA